MLRHVLKLFGSTAANAAAPPAPAAGRPVALPSIRPPTVVQSVIEPTPIPQLGPQHDGAPVPYYPRRGPAVPAATPDKLVATQRELIRELRQASALSFDEFDQFIQPVIERYAAFVHLLPASECDHHSDLGGLFRHGLEVALNASRRSEGKEFALNEDPCVRKFQIFRWRACALLGGLLHDLGKAVIDVGAQVDDGQRVWNPHVQSLWAWLQEQRLDHYNIEWRHNRRHKEHDAISATALVRILPDATMRWMGEHRGRAAYDAMLMALTGSTDRNNPLIDIIKFADSDSVVADRTAAQRRMSAIGEAGSRAASALLVRAMRELVLSGEWTLNKVGSPLFHTTDGLYLLFPQSVHEVTKHLRKSDIANVPSEPAGVVDVLKASGVITGVSQSNGNTHSVHRIRMHIEDVKGEALVDILALRFASEHIIPDYFVLPPAIPVELLDADGKPRSHGTVQSYSASPAAAPAAAPAAPAANDAPATEAEAKAPRKGAGKKAGTPAVAANDAAPPAPDSVPPSTASQAFSYNLDDDDEIEPTPLPDEAPVDAAVLDPVAHADPATTPLRDRAREMDARDALIQEHLRIDRDPFPPTSADGAKAWLAKQTNGVYLEHLVDGLVSRELQWNTHLFEDDELVHAAFPLAFEGCGNDPINVREAFQHDGWLEPDPSGNNRTVVALKTADGTRVSCLRFSHGISQVLRLLVPAPGKVVTAKPIVDVGPYIRGHRAAYFRAQVADAHVTNAMIMRLGFHDYLEESYRDTQGGWKAAKAKHLTSSIQDFARKHNTTFAQMVGFLTVKGNPVTLKSGADHFANPDYDPTVDEKALEAFQRAHHADGSAR